MGAEWEDDSAPEIVSDKFAEFALAIYERHGVDAFGLGLSAETLQ